MDIAEINVYVFIAEIFLAIVLTIIEKAFNKPVKSFLVGLLLWTLVAFSIYLYFEKGSIGSALEIAELFLLSIPAGFILGYPAGLTVMVCCKLGGSIIKVIYELITDK